MQLETMTKEEKTVAVMTGQEIVITDAQSALDLLMTVKYETKADALAIDKRLIIEDFFVLSTGLAGEILQKFINYLCKVAIYGDFTCYTSKPLKDFIYESNQGKDIFFTATKDEAVAKLFAVL